MDENNLSDAEYDSESTLTDLDETILYYDDLFNHSTFYDAASCSPVDIYEEPSTIIVSTPDDILETSNIHKVPELHEPSISASQNGSSENPKQRKGNLHCCWGECKTDNRCLYKAPKGTFFIPFPKIGKIKEGMTKLQINECNERTDKAKRWVHLCGRKKFTIANITKDTYICSLHFIGSNGPTAENPEPIKAASGMITSLVPKRKAPLQREPLLKRGRSTNESANGCNETLFINEGTTSCNDTAETRIINEQNYSCDDTKNLNDSFNIDFKKESLHSAKLESKAEATPTIINKTNEMGTQTIYDNWTLGAKIETVILKRSMQPVRSTLKAGNLHGNMAMEVIFQSDEKVKYFTGLYPKQFWSLYEWLGPAKFNLKYWNTKATKSAYTDKSSKFSIKEELFITLLRLRRGFNLTTLAHFYGCSDWYIRNIFSTWIMFLFYHFKDYKEIMFPNRHQMKKKLPQVFKKFKNIRASIDCTEFKCQMPRDYGEQGNYYSSYKHHTTMKGLIAVTPSGSACFISDLYEGSMDDVTLFRECGFLAHVNPGDAFLVDRGFTVQDLLLANQATVFMPPFLGKERKFFTKEEQILGRRIAKARIHVERFNERLKKFNLLNQVIPLSLKPIASQLVYVACCLVNFQECLCT